MAARRFATATVVMAVIVALLAGVAAGEWAGWPFLTTPLERLLSGTLDRRVSFSVNDGSVDARTGTPAPALLTRFFGSLRVSATRLEIAAPAWSKAPHILLARDVSLELRYSDLWRAHRGQTLRIQHLSAKTLDAHLERLKDGRASWQFGPVPAPGATLAQPMLAPQFGTLQVVDGTVHYRDEHLDTHIVARLSLKDAPKALHANATGHYRQLPVKLALVSSDVLPWVASSAWATPVPVRLNATVGQAKLAFQGSAVDALHLNGIKGRFTLSGSSLAAVGDILSITLPTTAAFRAKGKLVRQDATWRVVIDEATVGASRFNGAFSYETGRPAPSLPKLSGRLGGQRLMLSDLGPAVGASANTQAGTSNNSNSQNTGKVLPRRPFDLASLRAMDANVLIDIAEVDLGTRYLEPLRPLHAHLQLKHGILSLLDMRVSTGQGQLQGQAHLDGQGSVARWRTRLRLDGIRIERWLHQDTAAGTPQYVSGRLNGHAALQGQGRSTADILASLHGQTYLALTDAKVSHLAIEKAGLDVVATLGLLLKGDDMLPVQCAVADLVAQDGVLRPRMMVLDTAISAIWVEGSLSLASEALALRVLVMPKDFSLISLRMPLQVSGTFAQPSVSFDTGALGLKLGASVLLSLATPLGALIPLIDPGDAEAARRGAAGCQALVQRSLNAARRPAQAATGASSAKQP